MFQRILDGATTLAVLAVCILILAQAVRSYNADLPPSPPPSSAGAAASAVPSAGDRLEPIGGLDISASPRTLVMAIQSSCRFCTESMPFYRSLAQKKGGAIRLVVVAPDDPVIARKYVDSHGFAPNAIATSDLPRIHVGGTPTLLLINASGVIEKVWMGKLTPEREKEVLTEVAR